MCNFGRFVLLFFAVLAPICLSSFARPPQGRNTDLSKGASFTFEVGKNLPPFTLKIIPNKQPADQYGNAQSTISDIEVYRGDSKVPSQHLKGCNLDSMEPPPPGGGVFRTEDYNFDGYQDVFLTTWWGGTGNFGGCIWLYEPKTGRFSYSKEFSDIDIHDVDADTKTLSSISNSSAADWRSKTYEVKNNLPVLIWSEEQGSNDAEIHCNIQERRNGKMVTVLDVDTGCPEDGCASGRCVQ
jgi:hypothetical protein